MTKWLKDNFPSIPYGTLLSLMCDLLDDKFDSSSNSLLFTSQIMEQALYNYCIHNFFVEDIILIYSEGWDEFSGYVSESEDIMRNLYESFVKPLLKKETINKDDFPHVEFDEYEEEDEDEEDED